MKIEACLGWRVSGIFKFRVEMKKHIMNTKGSVCVKESREELAANHRDKGSSRFVVTELDNI